MSFFSRSSSVRATSRFYVSTLAAPSHQPLFPPTLGGPLPLGKEARLSASASGEAATEDNRQLDVENQAAPRVAGLLFSFAVCPLGPGWLFRGGEHFEQIQRIIDFIDCGSSDRARWPTACPSARRRHCRLSSR